METLSKIDTSPSECISGYVSTKSMAGIMKHLIKQAKAIILAEEGVSVCSCVCVCSVKRDACQTAERKPEPA